jgi:hypothetical protein
MKAILIKDDRDIRIVQLAESNSLDYAIVYISDIDNYAFLRERAAPTPICNISYELVTIRKNGDLVYRLRQ